MKTKHLFAILVALLMVSSIASASFMGKLTNSLYNRVDPTTANAVSDKSATSTPAAPQKCTANADCGTGTCTSCKCVAKLQAASPSASIPTTPPRVQAVTPTATLPTKTPTVTAVKPTATVSTQGTSTSTKTGILVPLLGRVIGVNLPPPNIRLTLKANGEECTTAENCISNYCKLPAGSKTVGTKGVCAGTIADGDDCVADAQCVSNNCPLPAGPKTVGTKGKCAATVTTGTSTSTLSSVAPAEKPINTCITECKAKCGTDCGTAPSAGSSAAGGAGVSTGGSTRLTCTTNSQCGTGKVCSAGNCINAPAIALQPFGGRCTTNSQCTSGRCSITAVAAIGTAGTCLCRTNTECGSGKTCNAATGQCAAATAAKTPLTLSSGLKLSTGAAISLSAIKPSTGTLTASTGVVATTNKANGVTCASATECTSKICSTQLATTTAAARKLCSATCKANTECITGKVCSSGKCVTAPTTANQNTAGQTTTGTGTATTSSGTASGASAVTPAATCISTCEANCETTCKAAGIQIGAACNNPAHCGNQCASGAFECVCEGNAVRAATSEVSTPAETGIINIEAKQPNLNIQSKLPALEAALQELESQAINDGLLTAEEITSIKQGYDSFSDEEKYEILKEEYNLFLEKSITLNVMTQDEAAKMRQQVKKTVKAAAQAEKQESKPSTGFFRGFANLFTGKAIITGRIVNVPGGAFPSAGNNLLTNQLLNNPAPALKQAISPAANVPVLPSSTQQTLERAARGTSLTDADKTRYKGIIGQMDKNLTNLETRICNKLKTVAAADWNRGKSCTTKADCGRTDLMKCETGAGTNFCTFDLSNLCYEKELAPSGSILSSCSNDNECTSGACRLPSAPDTTSPSKFCQCIANEDCPDNNCNTETGICIRAGSVAGEAPTPPPTPILVAKPITVTQRLTSPIRNLFGGRF